MKRKIFIPLIFFMMMFSSCLSLDRTISLDGSTYRFYGKMTFPRDFATLAGVSVDDLYDEFISSQQFHSRAKVTQVKTSTDSGFEYLFNIDLNNLSEEDKLFIPRKEENKIVIPFIVNSEELDFDLDLIAELAGLDSESQQVFKLFMSTMKLKFYISKDILPVVNTMYIKGNGSPNYSISYYDFGDSYCLEIPIMHLLDGNLYDLSSIMIM